jgi:hypoxanthine phosphoribosyltransferase
VGCSGDRPRAKFVFKSRTKTAKIFASGKLFASHDRLKVCENFPIYPTFTLISIPGHFEEIGFVVRSRVQVVAFRRRQDCEPLRQPEIWPEVSPMKFEDPLARGMRMLVSQEEIALKIGELAAQIRRDYEDRELTIVAIMSGAILFVADLIRQLESRVRLETLKASSYRGDSTIPGELRLNTEAISSLNRRHVLIVDDILDTGRTLLAVRHDLLERNPASLKTAVLLWKSQRTEVGIRPDYHGFEIPDRFVVGYGLDHDGLYRNLPDIRILE